MLAALHDGVCAAAGVGASAGCQAVAELTASVVDGLAVHRTSRDGMAPPGPLHDAALRFVLALAVEHASREGAALNGAGDTTRGSTGPDPLVVRAVALEALEATGDS